MRYLYALVFVLSMGCIDTLQLINLKAQYYGALDHQLSAIQIDDKAEVSRMKNLIIDLLDQICKEEPNFSVGCEKPM